MIVVGVIRRVLGGLLRRVVCLVVSSLHKILQRQALSLIREGKRIRDRFELRWRLAIVVARTKNCLLFRIIGTTGSLQRAVVRAPFVSACFALLMKNA